MSAGKELLQLTVGGLEEVKVSIHDFVPSASVLVEVSKPMFSLCLMVVEAASELHLRLLDLIQNHLDLGIYMAMQPAARWFDPWPDDLARPQHGLRD